MKAPFSGELLHARKCTPTQHAASMSSGTAAPPFDDAAKQSARQIAAAAGRPKTRDEGLKAIHAVVHRAAFRSDRCAWEHFGVSQQRFSEWKPLASAPPPPPAAPPPPPIDHEAAAKAARLRKTELQRERRHGDEQVVQAVVASLIKQLEQDAGREQRERARMRRSVEQPWCCPAGCVGSRCARAKFRQLCVPPDDVIRQHLRACWREQQPHLVEMGNFCGDSGYRFVRREEQARCWQLQEAEVCEPSFDDELDDVRRDFLATWDGLEQPSRFLEAVCRGASQPQPQVTTMELCMAAQVGRARQGRRARSFASRPEYLGPHIWLPADRFGFEHQLVGRIACARRGCSGCCYCRGQPPPPIYLHVVQHDRMAGRMDGCRPLHHRRTVDQLTNLLHEKIADNCRELLAEPVPPYLMERPFQLSFWSSASVIQVSGSVRDHISAHRLACWAEDLRGSNFLFQVLSSDADECAPTAEEQAACDAHLTRWRQVEDEQEAARIERSLLDLRARHEARRGCGQRIPRWNAESPNVLPACRRGDLVYHPPPPDRSTGPLVAVVMHVCTGHGGVGFGGISSRGCPTGDARLLFWSPQSRRFTSLKYDVPVRDFTLMPPCCGRGAGCPHLAQSEDPQWPNGDALRREEIEPIPEALRTLFDAAPQRRRNQREELEKSYSTILDPLGERRREREREAAERREREAAERREREAAERRERERSDADALSSGESDVDASSSGESEADASSSGSSHEGDQPAVKRVVKRQRYSSDSDSEGSCDSYVFSDVVDSDGECVTDWEY